MNFAVVTLGSAGDLHPFLAVARALRERGHNVHLLSQAPHQAAAAVEGVAFRAIASAEDHERTLTHPKLWHPIDGFGVLWRHLAVPSIGPTIDALGGLADAAGAPLTVLASPIAAGARLAKAKWPDRIRLLSGYTAPIGLRSLANPMYLGATRVPSWVPSWPRKGLWSALDHWKLEPMAKPKLQEWARRLGLEDIKGSLFGDWLHGPEGGVALYPDWFAPVPGPWQQRNVSQVGFPLFAPTGDDQLAPCVERFIEYPERYAVVYPGSAAARAREFVELVRPTIRKRGLRMLVLAGTGDDPAVELRDELWIPRAPLPSVLAKATAFVHHGGIGSLAQGVLAHVPQLVLASAYDQFENGARLEGLGAGAMMPLADSSIDDIEASFERALKTLTASFPTLSLSKAGSPNVAVAEACRLLERT